MDWKSQLHDAALDSRGRLWFVAVSLVFLGVLLPFAGGDERYRTRRLIAAPIAASLGLALSYGLARLKPASRSKKRSARPAHPVSVFKDGGDYWAECDCGWAGPNRSESRKAIADAKGHSPTVQSEVVDDTTVAASSMGLAFATRGLLETQEPVFVMLRVETPNPLDSGWRFYGKDAAETDELVETTVQAVMDRHPIIEPLLSTDPPCAFERIDASEKFRRAKLRVR